MKEISNGYAVRLFGSKIALQAKLRGLIRAKIAKKELSYAQLDEICGFGITLPGKRTALPKTAEFLVDASKVTELVWSLACTALGLTLDSIKVKINEETYQHALTEMKTRELGQGPPEVSEAKSVKIFVLMRALSEIA
jgi:hypothetical protein